MSQRTKFPEVGPAADELLVKRKVRTGLPTIDTVLGGGFAPGRLVVLCGRPSPAEPSGKSTLALQLALQIREQDSDKDAP